MNVAFVLNGVILDKQEREYVVRKVESASKIASNVQRAQVEIVEGKRNDYTVDVIIITDRNEFRATEVAVTVMIAIDLIEDQLKVQIRDDKKRRETITRRGARSIKKKLTLSEDSRL